MFKAKLDLGGGKFRIVTVFSITLDSPPYLLVFDKLLEPKWQWISSKLIIPLIVNENAQEENIDE